MKKPQIGNRLVPLLDLIFLLLIFFIILPHGIRSKEIREIKRLKEDIDKVKQEARQQNRDLRNKLKFYRFQYGSEKQTINDLKYRMVIITLSGDRLYLGVDLDHLQPVPKNDWQTQLQALIKFKNYDSVVVQIRDNSEQDVTYENTLYDLIQILQKLEVVCSYTIVPIAKK